MLSFDSSTPESRSRSNKSSTKFGQDATDEIKNLLADAMNLQKEIDLTFSKLSNTNQEARDELDEFCKLNENAGTSFNASK